MNLKYTVLRFHLALIQHNIPNTQICDITNIESHHMVVTNTDIVVCRFADPIDLLIASCLHSSHHFENIAHFSWIKRSSGKDTSVLFTILESNVR